MASLDLALFRSSQIVSLGGTQTCEWRVVCLGERLVSIEVQMEFPNAFVYGTASLSHHRRQQRRHVGQPDLKTEGDM